MNRAEFERLLRRRELASDSMASARELDLAEQAREELPADVVEFVDRFVWFEHLNTHDGVRGLRPHLLDWFADRVAWRWRSDGTRLPGKDITLKFRRGSYTTCTGIAPGIYTCMRHPRVTGRVYMQSGKADIIEPIHKVLAFIFEEWGRRGFGHWARAWRRVGNRWLHENGSNIAFSTAAVGLKTAGRQARGGGNDWVLASEIGWYSHCGPLLDAVLEAAPPAVGVVVAETTTDGDPEHEFSKEYEATKRGVGRFDVAHFAAWHSDPLKVLAPDDPTSARVLAPTFDVPQDDREAERALGLAPAQIAYRRSRFNTGPTAKRLERRRENPEDDVTIFRRGGPTWLSGRHLRTLELAVQPPKLRRRLGPLFSVSIWRPDARFIIAGVDNAARDGKDYKAVVGLDPLLAEQAFEIHGRATDHELAGALHEVALEFRCPIVWVPERNKAKDLIIEMRKIGLRLYHSPGGAAGKGWGVLSSASSRPRILSAIAEAVEGSGLDGEGEGPQWLLRSKYLVAELRSIRVGGDGKIRGYPHDDLAIGALGVALYALPRIRVKGSGGTPRPKSRDEVERGSRRLRGGPA